MFGVPTISCPACWTISHFPPTLQSTSTAIAGIGILEGPMCRKAPSHAEASRTDRPFPRTPHPAGSRIGNRLPVRGRPLMGFRFVLWSRQLLDPLAGWKMEPHRRPFCADVTPGDHRRHGTRAQGTLSKTDRADYTHATGRKYRAATRSSRPWIGSGCLLSTLHATDSTTIGDCRKREQPAGWHGSRRCRRGAREA